LHVPEFDQTVLMAGGDALAVGRELNHVNTS
jgi:hypothetical protein